MVSDSLNVTTETGIAVDVVVCPVITCPINSVGLPDYLKPS